MKFHEALLLIILLILGFFAADAMGWIPRQAVAGQPQPQIIYVPVQDTAVPASAPGMATAVPWEDWVGEPATAVPNTVIIAAPATWTPEAAGPRLVQGCSLSRGTCPGQGEP